MLIEERLQLQQGKKLGITPDEEVQKVLVGMAQNNQMTPEQLGAAPGQMGVNMTTLKDRIRSQVVWKDVVRRKFRHDVSVGDAEVNKALTEIRASRRSRRKKRRWNCAKSSTKFRPGQATRQPSPGSWRRSRRCAQSSSLVPMSRR